MIHSLGSRRILKVCLENTDVNFFRYSGTGVAASALVWKALANHWEMVNDTQISMDGGGSNPVPRIQSPSSMEMGSFSESMASILESSSELWFTSGTGPME